MAESQAGAVVEREAVIRNKEGLHFRPIMQLVDAVSRYQAKVTLHCEDRQADARSPMELLMLVATQGCRLRLCAVGEDAEPALKALAALIESGFNEA
jgi:phosphotransferase system HPr (HPr) family protein